jgi:hypothetical protein
MKVIRMSEDFGLKMAGNESVSKKETIDTIASGGRQGSVA